jgi:Arc/MetJ-type ribon-helix-helix transcriptional regulator
MSSVITVRMSDERRRRLDALVASGRFASRAEALTWAVDRLLDAEERRAIDRAIVEGYTRIPPTADEDDWAEWSTHESVREEPW